MLRLNPYIAVQKRVASNENKLRTLARETYLAKKEGVSKTFILLYNYVGIQMVNFVNTFRDQPLRRVKKY